MRTTLLIALLWLNLNLGYCEQPLIFVSAPDVHILNKLKNSSPISNFLLNSMAAFNPQFVLLPGDLGTQHWWAQEYKTLCAPGGTLHDVIMGCGEKAYRPLLSYMKNHGLPNVYVAVGDHEIGDNNWPMGARSDAVPYFKQAFAKYFTQKTDGGSKFTGSLGNVPMRPIGTAYANTSYAFQAANVLFVVIDQFRQDNTGIETGRRGTVQISVGNDGHLQWLEKLLAAAKQQPKIQHIIVVGHVPVLSPVRGMASSMIYFDSLQNSGFWQLLRKYQVDVYLAGEVHQTTVTQDPRSHIMQIIHKGGCCKKGRSGFLVGRAYSDRIEFELQTLQIKPDGDKVFVKTGTFVINKTAGHFSYQASGELTPINPNGLVVHYSFDTELTKPIKNYGSFGASYDATAHNAWSKAGILDKAASFNNKQNSRVESSGINPFAGQQSRTISVWLRTSATNWGYIYPAGKLPDSSNSGNAFRLLLANGILQLQIDHGNYLSANQGLLRLNDNNWHHVAVSFNRNWTAETDNVIFYIDGQKYPPLNKINTSIFTETNTDTINIGSKRADQFFYSSWNGLLDDFAIWTSALMPTMVKAIKNCAKNLHYNASNMEALFNLYRKRTGSAEIKGITWQYSAQLASSEGVCEPQNGFNRYALKLDAQGRGVIVQ